MTEEIEEIQKLNFILQKITCNRREINGAKTMKTFSQHATLAGKGRKQMSQLFFFSSQMFVMSA